MSTAGPRPLRVLCAIWHLRLGGAERWLADLLSFIPKHDLALTVVTVDEADHDPGLLAAAARAGELWPLGDMVPPHRRVECFTRLAAGREIDVLYTTTSGIVLGALPELRRRLPRLKVACQLHAASQIAGDRLAPYLAGVDRFLLVSDGLRETLRKACGPCPASVIRLGIDLDRFAAAPRAREPGPFRVLYLARLDEAKDPLLMCAVARALAEAGLNDVVIDVVGDGPLAGAVDDYVRRHGLTNLRRHGAGDPAAFYRAAHALLLTSRSEGIPLVALEAAAAALPVVAPVEDSSIGEVLTDQHDGLLIGQRADPQAYLRALRRLRDDEPFRLRLSGNAHAGRLRHDVRAAAARYRKLFQEMGPT